MSKKRKTAAASETSVQSADAVITEEETPVVAEEVEVNETPVAETEEKDSEESPVVTETMVDEEKPIVVEPETVITEEETPVVVEEVEVNETPVAETEEKISEEVNKPLPKIHVDDTTNVIVIKETEEDKKNKENLNPVTETYSGKIEINGKDDKIQMELCKKYKCKFAQSYFMKICATNREFSLFSMIETYFMNKTAYIGLTSLEDLAHIKDVMENNNISFKYKILDPTVKKQFLQKLEFNTQYAVTHK